MSQRDEKHNGIVISVDQLYKWSNQVDALRLAVIGLTYDLDGAPDQSIPLQMAAQDLIGEMCDLQEKHSECRTLISNL